MSTAAQWNDRIRRRLKLRDMDILLTVIKTGSMGKAADALNMSQPAVSKAIAGLEHTLGVRLLDRNRQGVEPTEYGRAMLDGGVAMFDDLRQAVKNIEFLADPAAGEVRIGSVPVFAASFVTTVIDQLSQRHPRIKFHLITGLVETLHHELIDRKLDLAIAGRFDPVEDARIGFEFLFDASFVVAAGAQNPWARRRKIALAELVSEPWTLPPPESQTGAVHLEAFRGSGLNFPRATVVTDSPEVRMRLLATGRFLTIFPTSVLKFTARRPELKVLPVELPLARLPIGIVTLKNRTLSPVAQLFIDHAREIAKPLAKRK